MNCFDTENSNAYTCNFIATFDISYIFYKRLDEDILHLHQMEMYMHTS